MKLVRKAFACLSAALVVAITLISRPASAEVSMAVDSVTLATYKTETTSLNSVQKSQIQRALANAPVASKFICTGIRYESDPASVNILVRARAKAACAYAKQLKPELSTFFQNKPTSAKNYAGKVLLTIKTGAYPDEDLTFDSLDPNWVGRAAISNVLDFYSRTSPVSISKTVYQAPNVPARFAESRLALLDKAQQAFQYQFSEPYSVVLFSEKDGKWADQKLAELGGRFPGSIESYIRSLPSAKDCSFAFATWDRNGAPIYYACLNTLSYAHVSADHTPIHEYFHLVQNTRFFSTEGFMPLWLNEGPPVFFGFALAYGEKDRANTKAEQFYGYAPLFDPDQTGKVDTRRIVTFMKTASQQQIVSIYKAMELDPVKRDELNHYGFGAIAAQVLIAVSGVDAYFSMLDLTKSMSWREAFKTTYGLTTVEFYEKLVPYIHALGNKYY